MRHVDKTAVTGVDGVMLQDVIPKRDKMWWCYPKLLKLNCGRYHQQYHQRLRSVDVE